MSGVISRYDFDGLSDKKPLLLLQAKKDGWIDFSWTCKMVQKAPVVVVVAWLNFTRPFEIDSPCEKWLKLMWNHDFDAKLQISEFGRL